MLLFVQVSDVNDRVTILNGTVNDVDSRLSELDAALTTLEETVSQIDGRLSQLEVSGKLVISENYSFENRI